MPSRKAASAPAAEATTHVTEGVAAPALAPVKLTGKKRQRESSSEPSAATDPEVDAADSGAATGGASAASRTTASSRPKRTPPAKPAASASASSSATIETVDGVSSGLKTLPLSFESRVWEKEPGAIVCGVDEAGRGPLAGPVVCAAIAMLPPRYWSPESSAAAAESSGTLRPPVLGVFDSKQVEEEDREALYPTIMSCPAFGVGVAVLSHAVVDRINIFQATLLGMELAAARARASAAAKMAAADGAKSNGKGGASGGAGAAASSSPSSSAQQLQLHQVFIDGPKVPPRIAAAATPEDELDTDAAAAADAKAAKTVADAAAAVAADAAGEHPEASDLTAHDPSAADVNGLRAALGRIHTVQPVISGDAKVYSIAAASLVAKVTRDRLMRDYALRWPGYGLEGHKGYGTPAHQAAIKALGPSPCHRRTFAPTKNWYPLPVSAEEAAAAAAEAEAKAAAKAAKGKAIGKGSAKAKGKQGSKA